MWELTGGTTLVFTVKPKGPGSFSLILWKFQYRNMTKFTHLEFEWEENDVQT